MATIRAYTTIEQSKKLTEILATESADMQWFLEEDYGIVQIKEGLQDWGGDCTLPCWSLAALLDVLPEPNLLEKDGWHLFSSDTDHFSCSSSYDNPVDACYEMILKLHEQEML